MTVIDKKVIALVGVLLIFIFWWDDAAQLIAGKPYVAEHKALSEYNAQVEYYAECSNNAECAAIYGRCGKWEAVNKTKGQEARSYFKYINADVSCSMADTVKPCNVSCKNNLCTIDKDQRGCPAEYYDGL